MKTPTTTRREFIKTTGIAASSIVLGRSLARAQIGNITPPLRIRQNVGVLDPNGSVLETYRKAVIAMRNLPASDPRNWTNQAKIHLDYCPHGNWFFLPWHRAYLRYFEEICRSLTATPDFALPYWNWTADPQIPAAFWGAGNPLDHPRDIDANATISDEFVGQSVIDDILRSPTFPDFASLKSSKPRGGSGGGKRALESRAHDNVHVTIGADMVTFMSPLDPIFWLHHANVDRLWAQWNRTNANTTDSVWTGCVLQGNFVDASGAPQNVTVGSLGSTYSLGYRYDDQPPSPPTHLTPPQNLIVLPAFTARGEGPLAALPRIPATMPLALNAQLREATRSIAVDQATKLIESPKPPRQGEKVIRLRISDIVPPKDPRAYVRVFINCPYLAEATPINDPHYVSSFCFFGLDHAEHRGHGGGAGESMSYVFDLTSTLGRLSRKESFPINEIQVQMLAIPRDSNGATETVVGKVEVTVEEIRNSS